MLAAYGLSPQRVIVGVFRQPMPRTPVVMNGGWIVFLRERRVLLKQSKLSVLFTKIRSKQPCGKGSAAFVKLLEAVQSVCYYFFLLLRWESVVHNESSRELQVSSTRSQVRTLAVIF